MDKEIFTCGAQIIYGTFRSLDPALNWITGRKAMLKKEVIVEYKEQMLIKLDYLFLPEYYTQTLKIPQEYVRGFQYYVLKTPI
jgi:hypothetical protein